MLNSAEAIYPAASYVEPVMPGALCWLGLAASDPPLARAFYTTLFDWDSEEQLAGDPGSYTALSFEGQEVAIFFGQDSEARAVGSASHWTPFVAVEDVDRSAGLVERLGGTLLPKPQDLGDAGRVVPFQDPAGATLALWQPSSRGGAELMNERGAVCWHELVTADLGRAAFFYCTLFGWRFTADPRVFSRLRSSFTITKAEHPIGTIREPRDDERGISSGWIPYFGVESPEHAHRIAERRGGRTVRAPSDSPIGRTSLLVDPLGVPFGLLEYPTADGRGKE
jgi:uncharacterized protein